MSGATVPQVRATEARRAAVRLTLPDSASANAPNQVVWPENERLICQQLQQYGGQLAVCPPKTGTSEREVALDRTTVSWALRFRI